MTSKTITKSPGYIAPETEVLWLKTASPLMGSLTIPEITEEEEDW